MAMSTAPTVEPAAQAVMLPGWRLSARGTWALVWLAFYLLPTTVNIFSVLTEHERGGASRIAAWEPICWEYSSAIGGFAALPLVYLAVNRAVWARAPWRSLGLHSVTMLGYSTVHVAIMMGLRSILYGLVGGTYHMGPLVREFPYELRKDIITYLVATAILTMGRQLVRLSRVVALVEAQQAAGAALMHAPTPVPMPVPLPPVAEPPPRLELKVGTRRVFVAPEEILQVSAAGKYVEVMTAERVHLVRRSLADIQADLPPQLFVRVHRSRLLNRAAIQRVDSRPSGDLDITLTTGLTVTASRRFKADLLTG
ncbi:LytTR family DNA-binding domain-containing protein [Nitrospirillum sp. BR 11828]|uniref:LytTR family DNA-binding domain-containing protein n=1 Tax=Nitrospirillum sp. BR 11828 TaxID=3104325 RepID=UPI002ACA90AB|nr:LytTR family DNA-binding domain-containing protein [Nitrospirillum sp. BR 11828]MDZ5647927.1 LytTR family DNA-binding domain-containing protein [Nitrospirillum sp. BR 11828]